jgi:hypothetical protein
MLRNLKITCVLFFFLVLSVATIIFEKVAHAESKAPQRNFVIEQQLNCVQSQLNQGEELGWQDVCYFSEEITTQPVEVAASDDSQEDSILQNNRDFMIYKREKKIARELNDWEKALKHHREMGTERNWGKATDHHFGMETILEPKESLVGEKFARERVMPESAKKHSFVGASELFYAHYEEPDVMEQRGLMYGVGGVYSYRPNKNDPLYLSAVNLYQAEVSFAAGSFNYEAEATAQAGLQVKDKDDFMYEIRGILGREYVHENNTLSLYSGFAYRYLNDDDDGQLHIVGSRGFYGYERESNYFYVPVGATLEFPVDKKNTVVLKGEYDILVFGQQISHLSDGNQYLSTVNDDVTNDQKHGFGLRGSAQFVHEAGALSFLVEPFFRFWHIEDSEVVNAYVEGSFIDVLEPENETIEVGLKVGMLF